MIFLRESQSCFRRVYALYHHLHFIHGLLHSLPLSHKISGSAVSAVYTCAGHDQISDSGQPGKCLELTAHFYTQTRNFRNSSSDQRRFCVISITKSVCDSRCQSDHVFQ